MNSLISRSLFVFLAVALATPLSTAASAGSLSRAQVKVPAPHGTVTYVGYKKSRHWENQRRYDRANVVVEAPFTYVETRRRHRYVAVDAPFTSVRVHGRGVWVRAPFVDLYVPR